MNDTAQLAQQVRYLLLNGKSGFNAVVKGSSMAPSLVNGAVVRVERKEWYQPGDILVFGTGDTFVSHRLVGVVGKETVITMGDNRMLFDPPVPLDLIRGAVVAVQEEGAWTPPVHRRPRTLRRFVSLGYCMVVRTCLWMHPTLALIAIRMFNALGTRIAAWRIRGRHQP